MDFHIRLFIVVGYMRAAQDRTKMVLLRKRDIKLKVLQLLL